MHDKLQSWLERDGVCFFRDIGLRSGDIVLDFGCGNGNYSIPAGKVVGNEGLIYALDRDSFSLKSLMERASNLELFNIVPVHDLDELKWMLKESLLDVALFFDVIHSYYYTDDERKHLLTSISKMVKRKGLILIFPRHMADYEIRTIMDTLERVGVYMEKERTTNLIHDGNYTTGHTILFRKNAGFYHTRIKLFNGRGFRIL